MKIDGLEAKDRGFDHLRPVESKQRCGLEHTSRYKEPGVELSQLIECEYLGLYETLVLEFADYRGLEGKDTPEAQKSEGEKLDIETEAGYLEVFMKGEACGCFKNACYADLNSLAVSRWVSKADLIDH